MSSLIKCPACDKDVSSEAFDCPACGKPLRKAKRSFLGKLCKWSFILWNILMIVWLVSGLGSSAEVYNSAASQAEQAGAAIGTGIGVMMILTLWVIGDIILGLFVLFTRPKK